MLDGAVRCCLPKESPESDHQFVNWAGAWAEARADWPADVAREDGLNDAGWSFEQCAKDALLSSASDMEKYQPGRDIADKRFDAMFLGAELPPTPGPYDPAWDENLETYWPATEIIAQRALNGLEVKHDDVAQAVSEIGA